jgi:hypothetical protein
VSVATLSLWAIFICRLIPGLHSTRKDALVTADQSRQDSADSAEPRKQSLCPDPSHCIVRRRWQATSLCGSPESGTFRSTGKDPSLASPAFAQNRRCPAPSLPRWPSAVRTGCASGRQENDAPPCIVASGCVRQGRTRFGRWTSLPAPRRASERIPTVQVNLDLDQSPAVMGAFHRLCA